MIELVTVFFVRESRGFKGVRIDYLSGIYGFFMRVYGFFLQDFSGGLRSFFRCSCSVFRIFSFYRKIIGWVFFDCWRFLVVYLLGFWFFFFGRVSSWFVFRVFEVVRGLGVRLLFRSLRFAFGFLKRSRESLIVLVVVERKYIYVLVY